MTIRPLAAGEVGVAAVLGLARLDHPDGVYFVAWDGDEALGHARLSLADPPEVQDVTVREEHRRRGVASALTEAVEREAAARGVERLRVTVSVDNDAAQALYRARGYADIDIPPRRVVGTIALRTDPIEVDDTLLTWEKRL